MHLSHVYSCSLCPNASRRAVVSSGGLEVFVVASQATASAVPLAGVGGGRAVRAKGVGNCGMLQGVLLRGRHRESSSRGEMAGFRSCVRHFGCERGRMCRNLAGATNAWIRAFVLRRPFRRTQWGFSAKRVGGCKHCSFYGMSGSSRCVSVLAQVVAILVLVFSGTVGSCSTSSNVLPYE